MIDFGSQPEVEASLVTGIKRGRSEPVSAQPEPIKNAGSDDIVEPAKKAKVEVELEPSDISNDFREALVKKIKVGDEDHDRFATYYDSLASQPLGSWDDELANIFLEYLNSRPIWHLLSYHGKHKNTLLRIYCEQYAKELFPERKQLLLKEIEALILKLRDKSLSKSGAKLPWVPTKLIKIVYLLEDENLSQLFYRLLPRPSANFFKGSKLPKFIVSKEKEKEQALHFFLKKNKSETLRSLENKIRMIQRLFRKKKRKREEHYRIPEQYPDIIKQQDVQQLEFFGSPYVPQRCHLKLARRIVAVAHKVKFLKSIRHVTHPEFVTSIVDRGWFGQKTLLMNLTSFKTASLYPCDVRDGDSNAISFGAGYGDIDPKASGCVEFTFQFDKLNFKPVHCAFFKQQDFHFALQRDRSVELHSGRKIVFDHTETKSLHRPISTRVMRLKYLRKNERFRDFDTLSEVPIFNLISYDINNIEAVLVLNFFRYIDLLTMDNHGDASEIIAAIYNDIEEMSDEELVEFLEDVGLNLSDSMEFNFFGAHQFDFNALTRIRDRDTKYCLNKSELIAELQIGKLALLEEAKKAFPGMFRSYRFLHYLSENTNHPEALAELSLLRSTCELPSWFEFATLLPLPGDCAGLNEPVLPYQKALGSHPEILLTTPSPPTGLVVKNK